MVKEKNCVYLKTDPYIPLQQRDKDGELVEGGFNNSRVLDLYQSLGFQHQPLKQGYDMLNQCRWMSILYLENKTKEQIFKEFSSKTRQNIKNALKNNIKIRKLEYNELPILVDFVYKTGEKRHFDGLSLEYYQEQYQCFGNKAQAYYAYLDIEEYADRIDKDIEKEKSLIKNAEENLKTNPHSKNSQSRLKTAESHLLSLYKREEEAKELKEKYGKELGLAAAMFVFCGKEVVYLMSGSDDRYKKFKAPYALQWEIIQKAIDEGYQRYNFYGISGYFQQDQEGYGVFDFKRGFNAVVVELVGIFVYPIKPLIYKIFKIKNSQG